MIANRHHVIGELVSMATTRLHANAKLDTLENYVKHK